jgi:hypothetical protein
VRTKATLDSLPTNRPLELPWASHIAITCCGPHMSYDPYGRLPGVEAVQHAARAMSETFHPVLDPTLGRRVGGPNYSANTDS